MHEVRNEIKSTSSDPLTILSSYVIDKSKNMDIWRQTPYVQVIQSISKFTKTNPNQIKIVNK